MSEPVIRVEGLSKRYYIGSSQPRYRTLRDSVTDLATAPFKRAWRLLRGHSTGAADLHEALWALRDVSFEVQPGEVLGVIGRNGSGKSTLLKVLSRITEPTEGRVRIRGRVGSLLEVGTGFHPELTGRDNIYLNGAILGMKRHEIDRRFDEIVEFSEIGKFLDTPVKHYSSGMYVRLAFAVAAHLETDILLVDEVLSVGDAAFQRKCLNKMGEVTSDQGRTVLFVSHNLLAVQSLCTKTLLIDSGRCMAFGSTREVVSEYLGSSFANQAERVWPEESASGCVLLRCHAVRVRLADGTVSSEVDIQEPFSVELEYAVTVDGTQAGATLLLYNDEDVLVFSSISNTDSEWHGRGRPAGIYRSVCEIPANFLNSGRYRISLILWTGNYIFCSRLDAVVQFEVLDTGGAARGDYYGGWSGVVRPHLNWRTDSLQEISGT